MYNRKFDIVTLSDHNRLNSHESPEYTNLSQAGEILDVVDWLGGLFGGKDFESIYRGHFSH